MTIQKLLASCVVFMACLVAATAVEAETVVVHTNSGETIEGEIVRDESSFIIIRYEEYGVPREKIILRSDIDRIVRDGDAEADVDGEGGSGDDAVSGDDTRAKIAFVTLEEMVGPYFNTDALEESITILDELPEAERPDVVVLQINSGGGALRELLRLTEYIHEEVKPKYRVVSWIESAISAAAMTAWATNEIYMMSEGNIGACTGFSQRPDENGNFVTVAMTGEALDEILEYMEDVSDWGDHEPWVMKAMQVSAPHRPFALSAEVDAYGRVTWHAAEGPGNNLPGELVSPYDEILTLEAYNAERLGVSLGTADSKDELASLLGFSEWREVGHAADEHQVEFRECVGEFETRLIELLLKLFGALDLALAAPDQSSCQKQLGYARIHLHTIQEITSCGHSVKEYFGIDDDFIDLVNREITEINVECEKKAR